MRTGWPLGHPVASVRRPDDCASAARDISPSVSRLLAGVDKFLHKLVDWDKYLSPFVTRLVKGHGHEFMLAVGVVEIVAALGVMLKPRIFGYVVAFWLWGIVANLILAHGFYDIALRDFGLSLGALALARIARDFDGRGVDRRHDRDVVVDRS